MGEARGMRRVLAGLTLGIALGSPYGVHAQQRAIEDLRVSKVGQIASAQIVFACRVGYVSHTPEERSGSVRIVVSLHSSCADTLGRGTRNELFRSPSGELAQISEIEFFSDQGREATVVVRFDGLARVEIPKSSQRDAITLEIDTEQAVSAAAPQAAQTDLIFARRAARTDAEAPATEAPQTAPAAAAPPAREPLRLVPSEPERGLERYVVQLAAGEALLPLDAPALLDAGLTVYRTERAVAGRHWRELRVGFFDTESEAHALLERVLGSYPDAVIAIADAAEQTNAASRPIAAPPESPTGRVAEVVDGDGALGAAREAMLAGDYARAAGLYAPLARTPAYPRHLEALELLGLAYARLGQTLEARAAYRDYLEAAPDGADAERVRQRLAALMADVDVGAISSPTAEPRVSGAWEVGGGISQYVRNDRYQVLAGEAEIVSQSSVLSHVDLTVRRSGPRFDLQSRINALHVYDLLGEDVRATGDQALVSTAYVGFVDKQHDWGARIGRQSSPSSGVLGRYDGAHFDYRLKPDVVLNVVAGFPVESPHYALSDRREFIGASFDLEQIIGRWDLSVFSILQQVDGIADRQAIGGEAHYRSERWNLVTALDLDLSYAVANSALLAANWRVTDRLTLNARADLQAAPFLTTFNAVIGQPVLTVEELFASYSESQIRRLARDRTAQARSGSMGLSWPFFDRFQLNADVSYTEYDATVASGNVAAEPASERQLYYLLNVIGSSLLKDGDTAIFELRQQQTRSADTLALVFDLRLPFGTRLRVNPRLALSSREYRSDRSSQWFAEYTLRFLMRIRGRHRLEAELGGIWSDRSFPAALDGVALPVEKSAGRYINLGYWWEL